MELTYDMERPAAMPTAAPVGAVTSGCHLAGPNALQVHGIFAPFATAIGTSVKPWTTGYDRQFTGLLGLEMTGRPARRLGRTST